MKKIIQTIVVLLFTTFPLSAVFAADKAPADPDKAEAPVEAPADPDKVKDENIVATVNGTKITAKQLGNETNNFRRQMAATGKPAAAQTGLREKALQMLIARELLYQKAVAEGITIDKKKLEKELASVRKNFGNDKAFTDALKKMDVSEEEVALEFEKRMMIEAYVEKNISPEVTVEEKDIEAFYDENKQLFKRPERIKARHILIKLDKKADETARKTARTRIEAIQKQLKDGADFAGLAKKESEGPSGPNGGDLGLFGRGQMVKPFEDAAFALKEGEISDIVQTRFGYHLIKLEEKQPESTIALDESREKIKMFLTQQKTSTAVESKAKKLREAADVNIVKKDEEK